MRKKYLSLLLMLVLFKSIYTSAQPVTPKIFALVVGISAYSDNNIPNLKYAEKDAVTFAATLKSPQLGAVPEQNTILLTNQKATRSNILKELVFLLSRSGPEDLFIFYYAGHGRNLDLDGSGYFLTYDTESSNEAGTAVSMDEINTKISRSRAKMKLSFIDACHAGLFKGNGTRGTAVDNNEIIKAYQTALLNASDGNLAFMASSARQQSLEDDGLKHGVFTYYLIKGLSGDADIAQKNSAGYNDGVITVSEMKTYLTQKIEEATGYKQTPLVEGVADMDFPLSVSKQNIVLAEEIQKRPKAKKETVQTQDITILTKVPETETLSKGMTFQPGSVMGDCFGVIAFVNKTDQPLTLLKFQDPFFFNNTAINIPVNSTGVTPRIKVFQRSTSPQKAADCEGMIVDYNFLFKIQENGVVKYAKVICPVEAGKKVYVVISKENTSFSIDMPVEFR